MVKRLSLLVIAIYPREGTETSAVCFLLIFPMVLLQFIPARGRKLRPAGEEVIPEGIAIYPREGTETKARRSMTFGRSLQFIPARGRKRSRVISLTRFDGIAIYPREGTETGSGSWCWRTRQLQFIPARGRKHDFASSIFVMPHCNLSPRGDGNIEPHPFGQGSALQFIPARGRKLCNRHHLLCDVVSLRFIPARGRKRHKELPERFELFS